MKRLVLVLAALVTAMALKAQQSRGAEAEVKVEAQIKDTYALVVGISEYQSHPRIPNLNFADDDARAFVAYLKSKAGGSTPENRIIELYNQKATSSAIMGAFRLLDARIQDSPAEIKKDDRLFIYLSGHGGAFNVEDSYFFPTNADNAQDAGVAISIRTIKNYIENWRLKGVNVILIFDACRSATIGMGADGIKKVSEYLEAKRNGEILMVASSKGQEALEFNEIGHGLFTYTLLSGLYGMADKNNDGTIKGFEISAFLEEQVATQSRSKQFPFIDFNDYKSSTFAIVDPEAKAAIEKSFASAGKADAIAAAATPDATTQGRSVSVSPELAKLEEEFQKALGAGRLIKPENASALFWYNKLTAAHTGHQRLELIKLDLAAGLLSAAQQVLLNDISGVRLYTRVNPSNPGERREGYNLRYYSDALHLLEQYVSITQTKLDDETECLKSYLMARDLIINSIGIRKEEEKALEQKAQLVLEKALTRCSTKAFVHFAAGQSLGFTAENQDKAQQRFRKAIQLAPKWSFPYNSLGQSFRLRNLNDSAKFYYEKAIKLNPLDIFPLHGLGYIHYNKGEYEKALGYFLQAYHKDTLQAESIAYLADCYGQLGRVDQQLSLLKQGLRLDKGYSGWYENLGRYYQFTRQMPDSALFFYQQAVKISPHNGYLQRRIAEVQTGLGSLESALNSALKATDLNPHDPYNYSTLARVYENQNLQELALENFNKAVELAPGNPWFVADKGYFLYIEGGNQKMRWKSLRKYRSKMHRFCRQWPIAHLCLAV